MSITRRDLLKVLASSAPILAVPKGIQASSALWPKVSAYHRIPKKMFENNRKFNFNSDWKVFVGDPENAEKPDFNDKEWKGITLPYAWNEDDAFRKDIKDLSTGIAWYRKHFKLPGSLKGKKIFFECEGLRQAGEFYVNGQKVGLSENGVMAFGFDLTDVLHYGEKENIISVRTDNSWDYREKATNSHFQWNNKNFYANYGGMNKNVFLHVTNKLYQTLPLYSNLKTKGVYIYANDYNLPEQSAVLHAESEIKNEENSSQKVEYEVVVSDLKGKEIKKFKGKSTTIEPGQVKIVKAEAKVKGLYFWSWGYGYLYNVETILKVDGKIKDVVNTKTGFRKTAFKNGMIYLNDRVIQVHGYAQRTTNEWPAIGSSVPAWLSDYSNGLMVENNANLVRWMHVTPWKQDVESCDRVGLMQAMPAGDSEGDVKGRRWEQRKEVMRDAIIYNRNNPSIIFYECGNHGISEEHMREMKDIRNQFDSSGGRAIGSREMLDSKEAEYGGEMLYINKSSTIPFWAMEYSRDEGLRKYWDNYTAPFHKDGWGKPYKKEPSDAYNHNMQSFSVEAVRRWYDYWKARPGTGRRVNSGGVHIVFSDSNTHHRSEVNYRVSGKVDAMRIKKQNFFANKMMWDGWVDVDKDNIYIIGHWNYYRGVRKDVYVVSSADQVELFKNGKSLGKGEKSHRFLYQFRDVKWEPGSIEAKGYDENGKELCSTSKNTVGKPVALRLTQIERPTDFLANGQDLAMVEVEVIDQEGNRCPTALDMIHFNLNGPAEWRGGIAKGPGNFILYKDIPVEGGVNRVLIRSTTQAGRITLEAAATGLKTATLTFRSRPFATQDGLTSILPDEGLPIRLDRGPSPRKQTYHISRIPLMIASATAGVNKDKAQQSYDDNERTAWENDGKLSTAWIEYTLEKESEINQVVMKLNRFRTKSYPLIISVDGTIVYAGNTDKNKGYYTAVCQPVVKGKKVKIQMTDLSQEEDTYGKELSGKKLEEGVISKNKNAEGTLNIIEVEIYKNKEE